MSYTTQQLLTLTCTEVFNETADVKTFRFITQPNQPFSFKAGQFVTLKLNIANQEHQRCYSISSSPHEDKFIELTIKKVSKGIVSNWLLNHFKVGENIEAVPPSGTFCFNKSTNNKLLLISAGSGISPMLSMIKQLNRSSDYNIKFHHSARTQNDLIAHDALIALAKENTRLDLSYNFSQEHVSNLDTAKTFDGRVCKHMLSQICSDIPQRDVFVCGPPEYMSLVNDALQSLGLPAAQYFQESFELQTIEKQTEDNPDTFDLTFSHSNIVTKVAADQTILEAAEASGIYLDYSCSSGICGSCTSYLQEGSIHAPQAKALDESDIENGDFLPCCSFARSNLVVDL
jgi:ferredoxin-NADP reductase